MSELVECCIHNLTGDAQESVQGVDDVRTSRCLDRCDICRNSPFLVVAGEPVTGQSYRSILATRDQVE